MFKVSNRYTRKRCLLISKITLKKSERRHLTTSYLPEVPVQKHVLDSFSRIYTNLKSSPTARNFNNSRTIYVTRNQKSLPKYLIHQNSEYQHFFSSEKTAPKVQSFQLFTLYSEGRHFSNTKLDILIFCNMHLEIDF